jgi:hypothetical protein
MAARCRLVPMRALAQSRRLRVAASGVAAGCVQRLGIARVDVDWRGSLLVGIHVAECFPGLFQRRSLRRRVVVDVGWQVRLYIKGAACAALLSAAASATAMTSPLASILAGFWHIHAQHHALVRLVQQFSPRLYLCTAGGTSNSASEVGAPPSIKRSPRMFGNCTGTLATEPAGMAISWLWGCASSTA